MMIADRCRHFTRCVTVKRGYAVKSIKRCALDRQDHKCGGRASKCPTGKADT